MEELLYGAIKGEEEAFTSLMLSYEKDLYKIAKLRLNKNDDICDAMQNTLLLVYKNVKKIRNISFFKTWVIKILINECNKIYKKQKNVISFEDNEMEKYISNANTNNLSEDLDFEILIKILNYDEKQIIQLYYGNDLAIKDISMILQMNENTIKTKMRRAKLKIKNYYEGVNLYE